MDVDRATESLPTTSKERPNFRRELYSRSTDRSTVEDMADMVVHRVIGQAANCIERSLGMKFSMENLKDTSFDENEDNSSGYSAGAAEEIRTRQMKRSRIVDIPPSSQFTPEKGLTLVNHLVDSWNLNRAIWERHSELVNVEETPNSASHTYKVVFYPVCKAKRYIQITASVDFNLIVNHLDGEIPVKVEFRLEGQRYRHEPGQFRFREKWLIDIIEHKKKLIRQVSL